MLKTPSSLLKRLDIPRMFTFVNGHSNEDQDSSAASDSETVTSMSDPQDPLPESIAEHQGIINVGLSDERTFLHRPMLEVVDRLRSLGLQFDLDLPQIVVVGMQNVGKSSLIEGISGIRLPRSNGTCTRCPVELRMKRSAGPWKCSVSLQFTHDEEANIALSPPRSIEFGASISNPLEVEERVRKAQEAILTPSAEPAVILRGSRSGARELQFSRNYISIAVEGSNMTDLSFVDLPGLVASSRQGDESDILMIENLVHTYINKPSTLILLAVTCETDFYTHGAYRFVKKYDPDGVRTIGVLTKPDRIPKGDEEPWTHLIMNDGEQLDLGWFCVKQPDSTQLKKGLSWNDARHAEKEWFDGTSPWDHLPVKYSKQLTTMNLVERLGETLANLVSRRLPEVNQELEVLLQETQDEMRRQPVPPSEDALAQMMNLISTFCSNVARHTEGIPATEGLIQSINEKQAELRRAVLSLAPEFRPYNRSETAADLQQVPPCEFLDGEEEDGKAAESRLVMYIDEVMDLLKRSKTRELPDYYPYEIPKHIIENSIRKWRAMSMIYFDEVGKVTSDHYKKLVEETFGHYERGGLLDTVQMTVTELLQIRKEATREQLRWLLDAMERPFTLNVRYLADFKNKFISYYKTYRYNVLNRDPATYIQTYNSGRAVNYVGEVLLSLRKMGMQDVKASDLAKLLPDDDCAPALNLMAVVSAYFQVASKRFIDIVPAAIDEEFVRGLSSRLQTTLYRCIVEGDVRKKCESLLQEPASVTARRSKLENKLQRLQAAKGVLVSMRWGEI